MSRMRVSRVSYALHHIPTADGVKTIRNDFTAGLGAFTPG
jgi:hypothetical protein